MTGTKRGVPLNVYPGGVQIIDGDDVSKADAARGTDAIGARVASVVSTHLGPGRNKLFIRGIADSSFVGPTQATVGQYWGNSRITYSAPDPEPAALRYPQHRGARRAAGDALRRRIARAASSASCRARPISTTTGGTIWSGAQAVQHGQPGVDGGRHLQRADRRRPARLPRACLRIDRWRLYRRYRTRAEGRQRRPHHRRARGAALRAGRRLDDRPQRRRPAHRRRRQPICRTRRRRAQPLQQRRPALSQRLLARRPGRAQAMGHARADLVARLRPSICLRTVRRGGTGATRSTRW